MTGGGVPAFPGDDMKLSDKGLQALELEEGAPLRAYRDTAGVWTIFCGLTAASGVVKPGPGMVITREEGERLMRAALPAYEQDVEIAMTKTEGSKIVRPAQNEFDAGLSFHWNTGAIARASWVKVWKGARGETWRVSVIDSLKLWSKSAGKVLPSLTARREREAAMLLDGVYRSETPQPVGAAFARWGLSLSPDEIQKARSALRALGYEPGLTPAFVDLDAASKFQADHGLTVDGIIGRATLATLQRAINARELAVPKVGAAGMAVASTFSGLSDVPEIPHLGAVLIVAAAAWLGLHAWSYRDIAAVILDPVLPRFAAFLRRY